MKFESMYARETTVNHYGKRGMSWHGCHISYVTTDQVMAENGEWTTKENKINVYLHQIIDGTNSQSAATVMSMVEAAVDFIHTNLPHVKRIILQSDNAKCYQNNELRLFIGILNLTFPVKIVRYLFSETQDGKGPCMNCLLFVIVVIRWLFGWLVRLSIRTPIHCSFVRSFIR